MRTEVLDWGHADPRGVIERAVGLLLEGQVVVFPTDTVYTAAASALRPEAVARLAEFCGHGEEGRLTLAVSGAAEALDWAPGLSRVGRRLARRCWPGPMTLISGEGIEHGLASRLPEEVRTQVCPEAALRLRTPAHEAILQVMRLVSGPLLLAGLGGNGRPAATTAEQALAIVARSGDCATTGGATTAEAVLVIDDGPSQFCQSGTVVRVEGENWNVVSEGVLSAQALRQLLPSRIVFVCTGNTCRSPLAEALCKKLLAERLGCPVEELPARGFLVLSAGLAAMMGGEAAAEAVETARELGADLSQHRTQPLTAELLAQADHLIAMTRSHLRALSGRGTRMGPRLRLLSGEGQDIADPIGAAPDVYRACARQILRHLQELLPELQ